MQVVAHNLAAMFTENQLKINTGKSSKSAEKLSSGYRINRAADDAAGLSISEKMRKQIRGLNQAAENIGDGISLCQIADGALNETQAILQRINELAIQSANGTNSQSDRDAIQDEVGELVSEINRIAETTAFNNDVYPLNGSGNEVENDDEEDNVIIETIDNFKASGTPLDDTITQYNLSCSEDGIDINGQLYDWDQVLGSSGKPLSTLESGTYTLNYNGINFSFDIKNVTDLQDVIEAVDGTEVVLNVRDNSQPSIVGVTQAYMAPFSNDIPRYGLGMSKDQYFAGTHTLAADDKGVTMDGLWTVKWSDVYSENASSLKLSFGRSISAGGMVLEFALDNGSTLEDIISELDGYTFNTNPTGRIVSVTGTAAEHYEDTGGKITGCWQEVPEDYLNGSSDIWEKVQILPSEVFEGLGYTTDKVYLTRGFYGDVYFDLQDLSNSYVRFESEGNTVEYTLSDKGKDELRQLMNDGELLPRAEYEVEFEDNNGNLLTYVMRAWTGISFDKMMNYINDSDKDLFYRLAFSEYSIDIDPTDFSTRGDTGKSYSYSETGFFDSYTETKITHRDSKRNGLWIQSTNEANKGIFVPLVNATAGGIGVKKVDVSSYEGALKAIDLSGNAIDKVSGYRSMFGAYQNRMEHAYNINKNTEENTQAAESRIRDTDMAKEMVDYSANNILVQAGNAFLTQAMQNPQGVLQLLQ